MKKILALLCALLIPLCFLFGCAGDDSPEYRNASKYDFTIEEKIATDRKSADFKIIPKVDINDLELIIEYYTFKNNKPQNTYPLIQTKIFYVGDIFYGEDYVFSCDLEENSFTTGEMIYKIEYKVKSVTVKND